MTAASEFQKDSKANGDVDATVDTNMDVATDKTTSNVVSAAGFEQAPPSLDLTERNGGEGPGDGDAVVNEDIEGEVAARTTQRVVVSLIDITLPGHNYCAAPAKTATC